MTPGFADPVRDSQTVFRAVMDAMARPGRIHRVTGPVTPPAPLARATAAVLLTLVDGESPLWLNAQAAAAWEWVSFHCGARASEAAAAQFAVVLPVIAELDPAIQDVEHRASGTLRSRLKPGSDDVEMSVPLQRFSTGSDEEPEGSATIILQVAGFGSGEMLRLTGPGLAGEQLLTIDGLPAGFAAFWRSNRRLFPRGIDVILCAGDALAALPRTVELG